MRSSTAVVAGFFVAALLGSTRASAQDTGDKPKDDSGTAPQQEKEWGVGGSEDQDHPKPKTTEEPKKATDTDDGEVHPVLPITSGDVGLDFVIGFGKYHDAASQTPDADVGQTPQSQTVLSFILGFHYAVADILQIGARIPFTDGGVTGVDQSNPNTATAKFSANAFGAIALDGKLDLAATKRLHVPILLSVYLPTAAGDPVILDKTDAAVPSKATWGVQQAVMASRGYEDMALFASKRFSLAPGIGLQYDNRALHLGAETRFEMMFKTGGQTPAAAATPDESANLRSFAFDWVTSANIGYELFDGKLEPALKTWLAVEQQLVTIGSRDYSGPEFVLEPNVSSRIGLNELKTTQLRGELGFILPVGGAASVNGAGSNGFRIAADVLF